MNQKLLKLSLIFLFGICLTKISAQQTIATSGSNATGSGGLVSYTIGQVFYTTYTATAGSVAQGVQQAFDFSTLGIENNLINLALIAFPNPTSNMLTLKVKEYSLDNMYFQLYDIQGRILVHKKINTEATQIPMQNLAPATYFLRIANQNKILKIFKIIKN